jgi:putative heme-binding domain-containing protein
VHHKAEPYVKGWWGTRPAASKPARPKNIDWSGTSLVLATLQSALRSPDPLVRGAAMKVYKDIPDPGAEAILQHMATDPANSEADRMEAISWFGELPSPSENTKNLLSRLATEPAQPPAIKIAALHSLGALKLKSAVAAIEQSLKDPAPAVRVAGLDALAMTLGDAAGAQAAAALQDGDVEVRRTAIRLVGETEFRDALPALLALASDPATHDELLAAVARMPDRRALGLYLEGLQSKNSTLRDGSRSALVKIKDSIGDDIIQREHRNELAGAVRAELQSVFHAPTPIMRWMVTDAWSKPKPGPTVDWSQAPDLAAPLIAGEKKLKWREMTTKEPHGRFSPTNLRPNSDCWAIAYAAVESNEAKTTTYLIGSDDQVKLFVNGEQIYEFKDNRGWSPDHTRGQLSLRAGVNHIYLMTGNTGGPWDFSLAIGGRDPRFAFLFDNVAAKLDASVYRDFAMKKPGDATRGRVLFNDAKGVGCVKCHAVGGEGGKVGPDLVGVGSKYPREELIRSVLEPSNRVVDGYRVTTIVTDAGKTLSGIVRVDSPAAVELLDAEGKITRIPVAEIDERHESNLSLMPNGLKDGLTLDDFTDVIAYMESLKQSDAKK